MIMTIMIFSRSWTALPLPSRWSWSWSWSLSWWRWFTLSHCHKVFVHRPTLTFDGKVICRSTKSFVFVCLLIQLTNNNLDQFTPHLKMVMMILLELIIVPFCLPTPDASIFKTSSALQIQSQIRDSLSPSTANRPPARFFNVYSRPKEAKLKSWT